MSINTRIGIIGGNGWLGKAIALPALAKNVVAADRLTISCRSGMTDAYRDWPAVSITADNAALASDVDVTMLSVRPQDFPAVSINAAGKLVVSVMAGVTCEAIAKATGATRIIRAMPNAAAEIGLAFTPWFATDAVTEADRGIVSALFSGCGTQAETPDEGDIDYFTGLTGSGPAFPALLATAMIEHAVKRGIPPGLAEQAIRSLMLGAGTMLERSTQSPSAVMQDFIDYRGTTAAGLNAMIGQGFKQVVAAGLDAAEAKARALSAPSKD